MTPQNRLRTVSVIAWAIMGLTVAPAGAGVVAIPVSANNTGWSLDYPNFYSLSDPQYLYACGSQGIYYGGQFHNRQPLRSLLYFSLSSVPANAQITSATLNMFCVRSTASGQPLLAQIVQGLWRDGSVCWNNQPSSSAYAPDGAYVQASMTTVYVPSSFDPYAGTMFSWDVTGMVNAWHTGRNFGLKLLAANEYATFETAFSSGRWVNPPYIRVVYDEGIAPLPPVGNGDFGSADLRNFKTAVSSGAHCEIMSNPHVADDYCVQMTTGSPVSLWQTVQTPQVPFNVQFDFEFTTTTGVLDVSLRNNSLGQIPAPTVLAGQFTTYSMAVSDPAFGNVSADLKFTMDGPTGSQLLLDNITIVVPEPAALSLLALGGLALLRRCRGFKG